MEQTHPARMRYRAVRAALHAERGRFLGDYEKILRESAKVRAKLARTAWDAAKRLEDGGER